jgi:hypothetical protein
MRRLVAEIIEGNLVTSPRPAVPHAPAASVIAQDVGPFDREPGSPASPGGWWMLFEPELHLDEDVLVPNLAGWRRERMAALPNTAAPEPHGGREVVRAEPFDAIETDIGRRWLEQTPPVR